MGHVRRVYPDRHSRSGRGSKGPTGGVSVPHNPAVEQIAGSPSFAAAAHRER